MLDEFSYGEFLLWSSSGIVAYVNAIEDRAYQEVKSLLTLHYNTLAVDPIKITNILTKVFGPIACDPDPAGESYMIDAHPTCPTCPGGHGVSWEMTSPPKVVEYDIPTVTHVGWERLSDAEKLELTERLVAQSGL